MREPVVGIDLGTTYSAVASVREGRPHIIPRRDGGHLTPSMVGFTSRGERVVGERARLLAEEAPENVAFATKRFLGRRWTAELAAAARGIVPYPLVAGPSGEVRVKVAGRALPTTQVAAMVLSELKLDAEAHFGRPVRRAVITVPANFDDAQRTATKEAARIAGLEVLRLVNEPTSAAIAYGLAAQFEGRALVFDLGGGTLDVSILEVEKGVFEVKATGGDPQLGGEDFDQRIAQWLLAQVPESFREAAGKDRLSLQRLRTAAERAKRELSTRAEALISVADLGDHTGTKRLPTLETMITREFFEALCAPLLTRCLDICKQVLATAKLTPSAIDTVLLVGGMTRVPMVRRLVAECFGKTPSTGMNPDEVVALGAAVHAAELADKTGAALLIDVASHSVGVGVLGGGMQWLISKNTPVPATATKTFLPSHGGQKDVRLPIFQGESDRAEENARLGELWLHELPGAARAEVPIEVRFELASDGTLSVRALDTTSGLAEAVCIQARTDLPPAEAERLQLDEASYSRESTRQAEGRAAELFAEQLRRAEAFAKVLSQSAEENPSDDAFRAVGEVDALVERGRAALLSRDRAQMRQVAEQLARLPGTQPTA